MEQNINQEELKKQLIHRDRVIRILSKDGNFRGVAIKNSQTARTAQERHGLDFLPSFLLSRALSSASMVASFLKGEERVKIELMGNGPIAQVYAEALSLGETRGYVSFKKDIDSKVTIEKLSDAIGVGVIRVTRVLYNKSEPIVSVVPLQKGDVSTDLAHYYVQSEQIPTAVILDTTFEDNGLIKDSGGLMIQAMPGHDEDELIKIFESLKEVKSVAAFFEEDNTPKDMMKDILPFEFDVVKSTQVDFFCRCSKDNFLSKLKTLTVDEIKSMYSEGQDELVCHYCNEKYKIEEEDFMKLIEEMTAKKN